MALHCFWPCDDHAAIKWLHTLNIQYYIKKTVHNLWAIFINTWSNMLKKITTIVIVIFRNAFRKSENIFVSL